MPANFEVELISRIISEGCLQEVLDWGIRPDDFGMGQTRCGFERLLSFYTDPKTVGTVLNKDAFLKLFPQVALLETTGLTTAMLCTVVREEHRRRDGSTFSVKFNEMLQGDVEAALNYAFVETKRLVELGGNKQVEVGLNRAMGDLMDYVNKPEQQTRMSWPWPVLNTLTGGIQESDYVILYGRPKNMKTWQLCYLLSHIFNEGHTVLAFTKEMTVLQLVRRFAACVLKIDYNKILRRHLTEIEHRDLEELHDFVQDPKQNLINFLDASEIAPGQDTIGWLQAKIDRHEPSVCLIDGLHLLSEEQGKREQADHLRVRNISRQLRHTALSRKIPIIATVQANRKAEGHSQGNLGEIAYSDAIGQDATLAIRIVKERSQPTVAMVFAGAREFECYGFRTHRKVAEDFSQESVMSDEDGEEFERAEERVHPGKPRKTKPTGQAAQKQAEKDVSQLVQLQLQQMPAA